MPTTPARHRHNYDDNDYDAQDFDELASDDEPADTSFRITGRLEAPSAIMIRTKDLHKLIHQGDIDLSPPYQRDVVWTEAKQIKLIDSIYRNYYIPPIVFAVTKDEDGVDVRRCVDGKQRLTSIQKFIDGQIPYRDPRTRKNYWYQMSAALRGQKLEIPSEWKEDFNLKTITCVDYRNLPVSLERDIFQRVQLGMPLTAAEKLQAISSPWSNWIQQLSTQRVTNETGLADQIVVDLSRGKDFQSLAQIVYCCDGIPETRVPTAQKLEGWIVRTDEPDRKFMDAITRVLQMFYHIASKPDLNKAFTEIKQRVAPVEFVFIGVLLFVLRENTEEERADAIYEMRREIRQKHTDVRANSRVVKGLWEFITRMADHYETGVYIESSEAAKAKPMRKASKKKRKVDDSDDEQVVADMVTPRKGKQRARRS